MKMIAAYKQSLFSSRGIKKYGLLFAALALFVLTRILFSFHHHGTENQFDDTEERLECGYCLVAHAAIDLDQNIQAIAPPAYSANRYSLRQSQTPLGVSLAAASARAPPEA